MSGQLYAGIPIEDITAFDKAYALSRKPAVAALLKMPLSLPDPWGDLAARINAAKTVAAAGYIVDEPIDVWGWDPYLTMRQRWLDGFSFVGSAASTIQAGAGPVPLGAITVPDMSLPITQLVALFPPDASNAPPPLPPTNNPLGPDLGFQIDGKEVFGIATWLQNEFKSGTVAVYPEGFTWTDSTGAHYAFHLLGNSLMDSKNRVTVWLKQ